MALASEHIKAILATLPQQPGVYRMMAADQSVLYVGKARSLRQRVSSYFQQPSSSAKTQALVARIADIQIIVTTSETEALLLEQSLIKSLNPPYNILLRDDKSYPYIAITDKDPFPRLMFHRGVRHPGVQYFGPYPNAQAVRETLDVLQKLFRLRTCEDAVFRHRTRPCLQHPLGRCRAPCVAKVAKEDYAEDVRATTLFLKGRNREVQDYLLSRMQQAAAVEDYEQAAMFRDQIRSVRAVEEQQSVYRSSGQVDLIAVASRPGGVCVTVLTVRQGKVLGSRNYFPKAHGETEASVLLEQFVPQYYLNPERWSDLPDRIYLESAFDDMPVLTEALYNATGQRMRLRVVRRGTASEWMDLARLNAAQGLEARLANRLQQEKRMRHLADALGLSALPERLECFDISHSSGESTMASCVVFNAQGPSKKDYRLFHIQGITAGDDYAAMRQALLRRFTGTLAQLPRPDVLLIDGGRGQWHCAREVLAEVCPGIMIVGVAKGEGRKSGLETLHLDEERQLQLPMDHPGFLLIQHIRDEAHRFAVKAHRKGRDRSRSKSALDDIPGIGAVRRQALLSFWGSVTAIERASVPELATTPGFSQALAQKLFDALHRA